MKYRSVMNLWYPAGFWFWNFRCSIFRTRKRQCVNGMAGLQGCPGSLYDDDSCNTQVGFHWIKILLLLIGLKCKPIKGMCPWRIRKGWIQWIWNQKKLCSYNNQRISGFDYVIITSLWRHCDVLVTSCSYDYFISIHWAPIFWSDFYSRAFQSYRAGFLVYKLHNQLWFLIKFD